MCVWVVPFLFIEKFEHNVASALCIVPSYTDSEISQVKHRFQDLFFEPIMCKTRHQQRQIQLMKYQQEQVQVQQHGVTYTKIAMTKLRNYGEGTHQGNRRFCLLVFKSVIKRISSRIWIYVTTIPTCPFHCKKSSKCMWRLWVMILYSNNIYLH